MGKKHPPELKENIAAFVRAGHSRREAAKHFGVSASFVVKLMAAAPAGAGDPAPAAPETPPEPPFDLSAVVVSGADIADTLGVSRRSVTEFVEKGIVQRIGRNQFSLQKSVSLYCEHLRGVAAGRGGDGTQELTAERARLAREQADNTALKNAQMRRELVPATDVQREWTLILTRVRNEMLAVVSRVRQTLPHLTHYDVEQLDREIRSALEVCGQDDTNSGDPEAGGMGQSAASAETAAL